MTGELRTSRSGPVTIVRLDAPPMNVLSRALQHDLAAAIEAADADDAVRSVVVWGGPACFAAGADITALADMGYEQVVRWNRSLQATFTRLAALPIPVVAAVNGFALGGGLELALAADVRIAGRASRLGLPEVTLGIMPGAGGTQRLRALVGPGRAKELLMTGRILAGAEAAQLGIVEDVVDDADVFGTALALATELAAGPRFALAAIKEAVDGAGDGLALERALIAGLFATADKDRGMRSFLRDGPGKAVFT